MSHRNTTYVAFATEDIPLYKVMEAWRDDDGMDFDFIDSHDLHDADGPVAPEALAARVRGRMGDATQVVLIGSPSARRRGSDGVSVLSHDIAAAMEYGLPIVIANYDGDRGIVREHIPQPLLDAGYHTLSVSLQAKIIRIALDYYAATFEGSDGAGPRYYWNTVYSDLGIGTCE